MQFSIISKNTSWQTRLENGGSEYKVKINRVLEFFASILLLFANFHHKLAYSYVPRLWSGFIVWSPHRAIRHKHYVSLLVLVIISPRQSNWVFLDQKIQYMLTWHIPKKIGRPTALIVFIWILFQSNVRLTVSFYHRIISIRLAAAKSLKKMQRTTLYAYGLN